MSAGDAYSSRARGNSHGHSFGKSTYQSCVDKCPQARLWVLRRQDDDLRSFQHDRIWCRARHVGEYCRQWSKTARNDQPRIRCRCRSHREDQLAASTPDGLTIGWISTQSWLFFGNVTTSDCEFSLQKQDIIGVSPAALSFLLSCAGSQYKTFTQLLHTTTPAKVLEPTSQTGALIQRLFMAAFGIPFYQCQRLRNDRILTTRLSARGR